MTQISPPTPPPVNQTIPQTKPKKKTLSVLLIILLSVIGLLIICFIVAMLVYSTKDSKELTERATKVGLQSGASSQTPEPIKPTQIAKVATAQDTLTPTITNSPTITSTPTITITSPPTQTPTPTEDLRLNLSLSEFTSYYDNLTDLQQEAFLTSLPGKTVDWSGNVFDVSEDGSILVDIPGTLVSLVSLEGVSIDIAQTINKDSYIRFTGVIKEAVDFLGMHIYIINVQIIN